MNVSKLLKKLCETALEVTLEIERDDLLENVLL